MKVDTLKELLAICEQKDYVKPGVYQGMYNLLARKPDTKLFPILREHGIVFNVYR